MSDTLTEAQPIESENPTNATTSTEDLSEFDFTDPNIKAKLPSDILRIVELARRTDTDPPDFTPYLKTANGEMSLRPIQNEILWQASKAKGLLGLVGVGEGKTLASFLLPRVLKAQRPLLLVPASMRAQAQADWGTYGAHFHLPEHLVLRSYEEISTQPGLLKALDPDLIICDEAHKLKNADSARTRRFRKHFQMCVRQKKPMPMFVCLSGSITSTSIKDFWHLATWALKEKSPLPLKWPFLDSWSMALDKGRESSKKDLSALTPIMGLFQEADVRMAFQKNLLSAEGVVISHKTPPPCKLEMFAFKTKVDKPVRDNIRKLNETWTTPQGEELNSALELVRLRRQMICGFYYYWDWVGVPDEAWLFARSEWAKACRLYCARAPEGLDTPALLENAIIRVLKRELDFKFPRELLLTYIEWAKQKDKPLPPVGIEWFSKYFLEAIILWAKAQKDPPLIWYEHVALGHALHRITGWPLYDTGPQADKALTQVTSPHIGIISIRAHSQGKNLQVWGNHFVAHPLSDGARWEQLLGRSHRHGQQRATVTVTVPSFSEFATALRSARLAAHYIQESTGLKQRLLTADWS